MKAIIAKDFLLLLGGKNRKSQLIYLATIALFSLAVIAIETFLFVSILKNVDAYDDASQTFLELFLTIVFIAMTMANFFQVNHLFFDKEDLSIMNNLPVNNNKRIRSKVAVLFTVYYATAFIFSFPLFLSYFLIVSQNGLFILYGFLYPLLTFFLSFGICLPLIDPLKKLVKLIKKNFVVHVVSILVLIAGIAAIYYFVLNLFVKFVSSNDFASLLTTEVIRKINAFTDNAYFLNYLHSLLFEGNWVHGIIYLGVALAAFFVGRYIAERLIFFQKENIRKNKEVHIEAKSTSPLKGLMKKELHLLLAGDYLYSFSGLLLVTPFILPLIVKAIHTIFSQGVFLYYISIVPSFVSICDCLIIVIFFLTIESGYRYFADEKKNGYIIGLIPVDLKTQLFVKMGIAGSLSFLSILVTHIILLATGILTWEVTAFTFVESILLSLAYMFISVKTEFGTNGFWSLFTMYLLPLILFGVSFGLSFLFLPFYVGGLISLTLILAYLIPLSINVLKAKSLEMEKLL